MKHARQPGRKIEGHLLKTSVLLRVLCWLSIGICSCLSAGTLDFTPHGTQPGLLVPAKNPANKAGIPGYDRRARALRFANTAGALIDGRM